MKKLLIIPLMLSLLYSCTKERIIEIQPGRNSSSVFYPEMAFPAHLYKEKIVLQNGMVLEKVDSTYLLGGDILLTGEQVNSFSNYAGTKGAVIDDRVKFWPRSIVHYDFAYDFVDTSRVIQAINLWRQATDLEFRRSRTGDRIYFVNSTGNSSFLGCVGGAQPINLTWNASFGVAAHEIGHALGLIHEHQRSDRDLYIEIMAENIKSNVMHNFAVYPNSINYGLLDFNSIMIYGDMIYDPAFVYNTDLPVMKRKDGGYWPFVNRSYLTPTDIGVTKMIYGPPYAQIITEVVGEYENVWGTGAEWETEYKNTIYFYSDKSFKQRITTDTPRFFYIAFTKSEKLYLQPETVTTWSFLRRYVPSGTDKVELDNTVSRGLDEFGTVKILYDEQYAGFNVGH